MMPRLEADRLFDPIRSAPCFVARLKKLGFNWPRPGSPLYDGVRVFHCISLPAAVSVQMGIDHALGGTACL